MCGSVCLVSACFVTAYFVSVCFASAYFVSVCFVSACFLCRSMFCVFVSVRFVGVFVSVLLAMSVVSTLEESVFSERDKT